MPPTKIALLFSLFMLGMLMAPTAKFLQSQTAGGKFFIFSGMVIDVMAIRTFHADQVIL
jgi:hypothetical protein